MGAIQRDIAKNRFFLEKKYDSAVAIQESLSNLISQFDRFTRIDLISTLPKESSEIFLDALAKFITENNKASLLISEEFREKGNYFTQIFSGFHHKNIIKCNEYREFGIDVGAWLNEALLKEMNFTVSFYKDDYQFKGINQESFFKIEREIGAERFLDNEFLKWKEWRKKHKGK